MTNAQAALIAAASMSQSSSPSGVSYSGNSGVLDRAEHYLKWLNKKDLESQVSTGE